MADELPMPVSTPEQNYRRFWEGWTVWVVLGGGLLLAIVLYLVVTRPLVAAVNAACGQ